MDRAPDVCDTTPMPRADAGPPTRLGGAGPKQDAVGVFISYSRDDIEFADQLDAALALCGFRVTLDRHGISGGEDWQRRLAGLLLEADTVVFVLSPSSARSQVCVWEVEEAERLGKRILPIVIRSLEGSEPPARLRDLNYIFFHSEPRMPGSGFGTGLARLVSALQTDLDWLRAHTRYQQRASEWEAGGRPANRLLSGTDIAQAKAWMARQPRSAPEPTALQLDFIRASENDEGARANAERRQLEAMAAAQAGRAKALAQAEAALLQAAESQRRRVRIRNLAMAGLSVLALVATGLGWQAERQRQEAEEQRKAADVQRKAAIGVVASATDLIYTLQAKFTFDAKAKRDKFAIYERGASLGIRHAMHNLALSYRDGSGTAQDYAQARAWFEKAFAAGDIDAATDLAELFERGLGVPRDPVKALQIVRRGAELGDPASLNDIGFRHWSGNGLPQDYDMAREFYEKAAAGGHALAMFNLGVLHRTGQGVVRDLARAQEWNEKAAAKGNSMAMVVLGVFHEEGMGVPQDFAKAREWYEKAAAARDAGAMNNLGLLHENGRGVPRDYGKAREWYEKAAAEGNADAMNNLGGLFEAGNGVPRDHARARAWFERAAELGDPRGMQSIALIYREGRGVPQDFSKAREWHEKAAALGHAGAMLVLGVMYDNAEGVAQDSSRARAWFEHAAAKGSASAMFNLAILHRHGRGGPQDFDRARQWYEQAAAAGHQRAAGELERLPIAAAVAAGRFGEAVRLEVALVERLREATVRGGGQPGADVALVMKSAAWHALFAGEPGIALAMSERALLILPGDKGVETNRAHALLLLGRLDEARDLYLIFKTGADGNGQPWSAVIAEDFAQLRKAGISHPFMGVVERMLDLVH